ncbi:hypothetical protein BJ508DRAFT_132766 [Ascobolus immersus RN42]|uniref:Uncharacterized protein n=1 Tax=Ascobolus immersus RN42 TaxID=1160509 RepID=A0A3N4I3J4_ASCIM|nr:hypothetical protein BJ508DRAFT_132766 [Ascobolus immersus RN42]
MVGFQKCLVVGHGKSIMAVVGRTGLVVFSPFLSLLHLYNRSLSPLFILYFVCYVVILYSSVLRSFALLLCTCLVLHRFPIYTVH